MKTAKDFRQALGSADAGFEGAMLQTLSRLQKEEKKMTKKMSLSLAMAIALLMLTVGGALAAGMGIFGLLGQENEKLSLIEQQALENDASITLPAGEKNQIPVTFSIAQSFYDGQRLYVSYALEFEEKAVCGQVTEPNPDQATHVDFWGEEGEWYQPLLENMGVWEEMQRQYQETGVAGAIQDTAYAGDGMRAEDGTYLDLCASEDVQEQGRVIGYREFETPLPESLQNQEQIVLYATVYRSRTYYRLTSDGLDVWMEPDRDQTEISFIVKRSAEAASLGRAEGNFADYAVTAELNQSGGMLICDIQVSHMPESWMGWDSWEQVEAQQLDFVQAFRLYADGQLLNDMDRDAVSGDTTLNLRYTFATPQTEARVYALRTVYSLSGEREAEEIVFEANP